MSWTTVQVRNTPYQSKKEWSHNSVILKMGLRVHMFLKFSL